MELIFQTSCASSEGINLGYIKFDTGGKPLHLKEFWTNLNKELVNALYEGKTNELESIKTLSLVPEEHRSV